MEQYLSNVCIKLYIRNSENDFWDFDLLSKGKGVIDIEYLSEDNFLFASGGIKLYTNGYMCFLSSHDFGDLYYVVLFLIKELIDISNTSNVSDFWRILKNDLDDNRSVIITDSVKQELSLYNDVEKMQVKISYLAKEYISYSRNSLNFANVVIDYHVFAKEIITALREYFIVVNNVLTMFPNSKQSSFLRQFAGEWQVLENLLLDRFK